ncbi:alpha,alpha-trehalase TreF [Sphingopyxis panaciterrae]
MRKYRELAWAKVRRIFARTALPLACAILLGANSWPAPPADIYGELFIRVQEGGVFGDNKTFVDAEPRRAPEEIMADYLASPPTNRDDLRRFVLANFIVPGINDNERLPLRQHIKALWPELTRVRDTPRPGSSKIGLPANYVVPGGRFREIYYWDSYFTMLGLRADGKSELAESMIDDFVSLIERFGHIPNGTRSYYLSRSQPPFFGFMLDQSASTDRAVKMRRLAALRKEYEYWMAGADCASRSKACARVVRMPDGSLLNRYWDDRDTPRDESYAEDRATARDAATRPPSDVYRDLRAAAESGWDFSSRWFADGKTLASIRTTQIVPVDLNALLFGVEQRISAWCRETDDLDCAREFAANAKRRRASVDRYLWFPAEDRYADWDLIAKRPTTSTSAATLYPLFSRMASQLQADKVAAFTERKLLAKGGLRTTTILTGQQWDQPNGWAPLQWIAVEGLDHYRHSDLSMTIAERWLGTVERTYIETGKMLEKYDVEEGQPGGGGEYPLQDGFGWTNGVTSALLERYPKLSISADQRD